MVFFSVNTSKQKKFLTGRTMVEMIAVLAIIGILSTAAVLGYRYAVASKQANDLVKYLSSVSLQVTQRPGVVEQMDCSDFEQKFKKPDFVQNCTTTYDPTDGVILNVTYKNDISDTLISALEKKCTEQLYASTITNKAQDFIWGDLTHHCGEPIPPTPVPPPTPQPPCSIYGSINGCMCYGHTLRVYTRSKYQ